MSIYRKISEYEYENEPFVICTIVKTKGSTPRHSGSKMLVLKDGHTVGTIGGGLIENLAVKQALDIINSGEIKIVDFNIDNSQTVSSEISQNSVVILFEPVKTRHHIIVVGAGHVGKQVVYLAKWLNFRVTLSDERSELCNSEFAPGADQYLICKMGDIPQQIDVNENTHFVVVSPNSEIDIAGLPALINSNPAYIGIIGSKNRWENTKNGLISKGINSVELSKIHWPIGLRMKTETPEEIALSILAEILSLSHGSED